MARTRRAQAKNDVARPVNDPTSNKTTDQRGTARGRSRNIRSGKAPIDLPDQEAIKATSGSHSAILDHLSNEAAATVPSSSTRGANDTISSVETGRRAITTPSARRDTTGLDLADDDVFGDLDESFADGSIPPIPLSADTTMSWSNFKPRSRQSSIIGRNDPPIRPSSRSGATPGLGSSFTIGAFRRRAREPSILGTSRKPRSEASATAQNSDLESEGEFAPEAESTPLNTRRRTRASLISQRRESSVELTSTRFNSRKRKSTDSDQQGERPEKSSRLNKESQADDSDSELSELASPELVLTSLPIRPLTPTNQDELNAPPASSASEDEEDVWPDIHTLAKRRRRPSVTTPGRPGYLSEPSSPPSLTHSPNFPEGRRGRSRARQVAKAHTSPKFTSADLVNLLPKRRYKKATGAVDGSDDEMERSPSDVDRAVASLAQTRAQRKRGSRPASRAVSAGSARRSAGLTETATNSKEAPALSTRSSRRIAGKTYGNRLSDKENESDADDENDDSAFQPLPDDTFDMAAEVMRNVQTAEELKNAVRKFSEVDKWQLEFEEVAEDLDPEGAR